MRSLRPVAVDDGAELEFGGIEDDVADFFALPCVGDVNEAVGGLNDGGVGVFAGFFIFEEDGGFPGFAVFGNGDVEDLAAEIPLAALAAGVVVNEKMATVFEGDGVRAGVGIGQIEKGHF